MERAAWTEERLDDLAARMDAGFGRVDADIRELRGEFRELRGELHEELRAMRTTLLQVGGGLIGAMLVGFLAVIATIVTTA
jgi:hypothetical protein